MTDAILSRRPVGIAILVAMTGTACFSYPRAPFDSLAGLSPIRVYLNSSGSAQLTPIIGERARWVDGELLDADSVSLTVAVREVAIRDASPSTWAGERVRIPLSAVDSAGARRFNGSQTTVAAAGVTVGLLLLRAAFNGIQRPIGNGGGELPPGSR